METILQLFSGVFLHHWAIVTLALLLIVYHMASLRIQKLPDLPTRFLLAYLIFKFLLLTDLPDRVDERLRMWLDVGAAIALYCAASRILFSLTVETWFRVHKHTRAPKITRDLILLVAYAITVLMILRTRADMNLMGLITTSAVLTAVIGFAAQNTLGNLLAGLFIQMEHPFRIGDWLQYGEHIGKVINIGWEATRLLTFDDEMIIIPNLDVSKGVLKNHSQPTSMHAMKVDVGIEYGASPNRVRDVLMEICRQETRIRIEPAPVVRITSFGDFAINYQMRFFYDDFGISPELKESVMDRMWYTLKRHGIHIPYPIRDIHHHHVERRHLAEEQAKLRAISEEVFCMVPILNPLPAEARNLLAKHMRIDGYGDGEDIVRQGDSGDSLYIIHKGECDVFVAVGDKGPEKVANLKPPAFFGEMSLLTGEPRSATVRAKGDTTVFSIDKELFRDILVAHPETSQVLAEALAKRQADTAGITGKLLEEQEKQATRILNRIRAFFSITA